jgi:hypothetical protein
MRQLDITKQGPEMMADNPSRVDVADYTSGFREFKPAHQKDDWRVTAVKVGGALVGVLILWLAFGLWKTAYCWGGANYERCQHIVEAEPIAVLVLFGGAAALLTWRTVASTVADLRQKRAYAARTNLTLDRFGNQVPADIFDRMDPRAMLNYLERRYAMDVALKQVTAPHEVFWGVNSLSQNSAQTATALPELEAAGPEVGPLPVDHWMDWVNRQPHAMLAARTGGGKSTLAKYILKPRIEAGELAFCIDPHFSPGNWFELEAVGGGENWAEVEKALEAVLDEYHARLERVKAGARPEDFTRLTVLLDEAVIVKAHFDAEHGRKASNPWLRFTTVMGSGARKTRISVLVMTQSANCDDLGISGPLRENFTRIALDTRTIRQLINEDLNRDRRDALAAMLPTQGDYPAAVELNGEVFFIDRRNITKVEAPVNSADAAWMAGYEAVRGSSDGPSASEDMETLLESLLQTDGRTDGRPIKPTKLDELRALRQAGISRDRAREMGHVFENEDWTQAGK